MSVATVRTSTMEVIGVVWVACRISILLRVAEGRGEEKSKENRDSKRRLFGEA